MILSELCCFGSLFDFNLTSALKSDADNEFCELLEELQNGIAVNILTPAHYLSAVTLSIQFDDKTLSFKHDKNMRIISFKHIVRILRGSDLVNVAIPTELKLNDKCIALQLLSARVIPIVFMNSSQVQLFYEALRSTVTKK